jgi:hypothetical protein
MQLDEVSWDAATAKPPANLRSRLKAAMLYYRNDRPDGVAIGVTPEEPDAEEALKNAFDLSLEAYKNASPSKREEMLDHYMSQIDTLAKQPEAARQKLDTALIAVLVVDMMWLVMAGRVTNDEYNGTKFVWEAAAAHS